VERPQPRLVAVESNGSAATAPDAPTETAPPRRRTSLILVMLLVVVLSGLLAQSWRASQLQGRVAGLEAQLGTAQAELRAREAHLSLVREAVGGVSRELTALEQLVEQEPE
jgi:hypothetical protein